MDENFGTYKATLERLYAGFQFFYPKHFNPNFDSRPPTRDFIYKGERIPKAKYISEVLAFTDAKDDLSVAFKKLVELHNLSDAELAQNVPNAALREQQAATLAESEEKHRAAQEAVEKQKKIFDEQIKRAQAVKEKLEKETIHAKPVKEEQLPLSEDFVNQARVDPDAAINTIAKDMRSRIPVEEIPEDAIQFTATYIVANAVLNEKPAVEAFTAQKIKDGPEFKDIGDVLENQGLAMHDLAKIVADRAYGPNNPFIPNIKGVEISDSPQTSFVPLPAAYFAARSEELLEGQKQILDGKIERPAWMVSELDRQLEIMKAGGIQGAEGNYQEYIVQGYLQKFSPGSAATIEAANFERMVDGASGAGGAFGLVKGVAGGIATQVVTKAATKAITEAVIGTTAAAAAPETFGLSLLIGAIIDKAKDLLSKIQRWLKEHNIAELPFALAGGLVAGVFFGAGTGALAGTGLFGALKLGGSTAAGRAAFGRGVGNFFGSLAHAVLGAIAAPIIAILIGFPVVVALILFIINSGAYVVPPTLLQTGYSGIGGINMVCDSSITSSQNPVANAAINIASYLNQFHLNPLTVGLLNSPGWKSLAGALPSPALSALEASAHVDNHLQCVGFAAATAGLAYGQAFNQKNACSYIGNPPSGYKYVQGTYGMGSGDFFLINGRGGCGGSSPGHIGVVISVDGALISCADANMVAQGAVCVRHGCFALSQLTGYLRKK